MTGRARPGVAMAAAAIAAAVLAGCAQTIPGTAAMPTESMRSTVVNPPSRSTTSPRTPTRTTPRTTPNGVPPSGAASLTCAQYSRLDPADQAAAIEDIFAEAGPGSTDPNDPEVAKIIVDAMCSVLPQALVRDFLVPPR